MKIIDKEVSIAHRIDFLSIINDFSHKHNVQIKISTGFEGIDIYMCRGIYIVETSLLLMPDELEIASEEKFISVLEQMLKELKKEEE